MSGGGWFKKIKKFILGSGLLYASVTIPLSLTYSGKCLSEIQIKPCLAWFIARDTVPRVLTLPEKRR